MTETERDTGDTRDLNEILAALRQIARDAGDADHPADTDAEVIRRLALILSSGDQQ